jgi:asparagine synthetase B (glutamine-hydrolysing)
MCGIYFEGPKSSKISEDRFEIRKKVIARGPDSFVEIEDGNTLQMFGRLAIRNLASGEQPFRSRYGWSAINGELYNEKALRNYLINAGIPEVDLPNGNVELWYGDFANFIRNVRWIYFQRRNI